MSPNLQQVTMSSLLAFSALLGSILEEESGYLPQYCFLMERALEVGKLETTERETRTGSTFWNSLNSKFRFHQEEKQEANSDWRLSVKQRQILTKEFLQKQRRNSSGQRLPFSFTLIIGEKCIKRNSGKGLCSSPHNALFFLVMQSYNIPFGKSAIPGAVSEFPVWKYMKWMMEVVRNSETVPE